MVVIKTAKRDSWKFNPVNKPVLLKYNLVLSFDKWNLLKQGLVPKVMEDRWFVFLEDNIVYFVRSWTGNCIFTVEIKIMEDNNVLLHKVKMEEDKNIYRGDSPAETLELLIKMVINCNSKK